VAILASVSTLIIVLSLVLMPVMGITGVGIAILTGQSVVAAVLLVLHADWLPHPIVGPLANLRNAGLLRRVAPDALATLSPDPARRWQVISRLHGRSDTAIALVGADAQHLALLKVVDSPDGCVELARERDALTALHADDRLGEWRELIPRVLGANERNGAYCLLETNLPGRDARSLLAVPDERERFVAVALAALAELQRRTARVVRGDEMILDRWVWQPAARVRAVTSARLAPGLDRLVETLSEQLLDRRVCVGWVHGDFSADNILLDASGKLTGVVDWGQANHEGLVMADTMTLMLATELEATGQELGQVVLRWLTAGTAATRASMGSIQRGLGGDQLDGRAVLLLGWLHMVAGNLAKSPRYAANPVWMRTNVRAVLRSLADGEAAAPRPRSGVDRDQGAWQ
ncbi:MAG: aminoglycoside phosphotransferase family protein, partial [Sciscionella sp.]